MYHSARKHFKTISLNICVVFLKGHLLRGTLPRGASLQPWCQRRWGGGERANRLWLQARFCRGSTAGRIASEHFCRVFVCRYQHVDYLFFCLFVFFLCAFRTGRSSLTPAAWRTSHEMRPTAPCRCLSQSLFRGSLRSYAIIKRDPWRWFRLIHIVVQWIAVIIHYTIIVFHCGCGRGRF